MEKMVITETKAAELRRELKDLDEKISEAQEDHGQAAQEEGGLFNNGSTSSIAQNIARWTIEKNRILEILNSATIVKIDLTSEEMKVEVGDVVAVQITYEGEEPEKLKLQIDGTMKLPEVGRVTFASPLAKALLGKEIGESFALRKTLGSPTNADGIVTGIVKAKDLGEGLSESEPKKPYTLQKRS